MFGSEVKGDRASARQSLERYVLRGKADKNGTRYLISMKVADPLSALATENRTLKAEVERLKARIEELEARS
jgi:cell division protein FtsB